MIRFLYVAALAAATHDVRHRIVEAGGPNEGRYVRRLLTNAGINVAAPWCAAWVQGVADSAALSLGIENPLDAVRHEALVASYAIWAERDPAERIVQFPSQAVPGDLVLFNFGGENWDHIGILEHPPAADTAGAEFATLEANTNDAGSREGDGVYRKTRRVIPLRQLFVRWA